MATPIGAKFKGGRAYSNHKTQVSARIAQNAGARTLWKVDVLCLNGFLFQSASIENHVERTSNSPAEIASLRTARSGWFITEFTLVYAGLVVTDETQISTGVCPL